MIKALIVSAFVLLVGGAVIGCASDLQPQGCYQQYDD